MKFNKVALSIACAAGFTIAGASAANADTVTVKSGDTLSQIAEDNNTTVDSIQSLNSLGNIHLIFPGQQLQVNRNDRGTAAAQTANTNSAAPQTQQAPQQTQTIAAPQTTSQAVASSNEQAARDWIAAHESGQSYTAQNGRYYGKYQLDAAYLGGDYSAANQERVANNYVMNRYGSWANAKAHWLTNGWY